MDMIWNQVFLFDLLCNRYIPVIGFEYLIKVFFSDNYREYVQSTTLHGSWSDTILNAF